MLLLRWELHFYILLGKHQGNISVILQSQTQHAIHHGTVISISKHIYLRQWELVLRAEKDMGSATQGDSATSCGTPPVLQHEMFTQVSWPLIYSKQVCEKHFLFSNECSFPLPQQSTHIMEK